MPPPDGGDPLSHELRHLAGELFPPGMQEFGHLYLKSVVLAVATVQESAPECSTDVVVQKYCNQLREQNARQFAPFSIYMGGRYSKLLDDSLQALVDRNILQRRSSSHKKIDARVYEVSEQHADSAKQPPVWEDIFENFRHQFDLRNPFKDHYWNNVIKLAANEDAYEWVTSTPESRNPDLLDTRDEWNRHDDSAEVLKKIQGFEEPEQDAASLLYALLRDYKSIDRRQKRYGNAETVEESRRRFSTHFIQEHYEQYGDEILGEIVFIVGFFDIGEENWQDPDPDIAYLREHITATSSVGVKLPPSLKDADIDIRSISAGVLGELSEKNGEVVISPIALVKSDELPDSIIEHQRDERQKRIESLEQEQTEILADLQDKTGDLDALTEEKVKKQLQEALRDSELDQDEAEVYKYLLQLLATSSSTLGIEWLIKKAVENYPEYAPEILKAIGL
ncbi:hypothetical protein [Haloarcula laminariae]|uniref:hypothetical protein n=1 Tax=Haloarcula laminariae TaxID=2961577 RepID=UPI0021C67814|nr:hypothetical protein [Halomicroarcula laminariae]